MICQKKKNRGDSSGVVTRVGDGLGPNCVWDGTLLLTWGPQPVKPWLFAALDQAG